jgi:REP element-mobilizing transposase RayT
MAGMSYVSSWFHCVFSTKERRPLITPSLRERLWPFLGGIARQNHMKAVEIGGVADHVHILLSLPATFSVAKAKNSPLHGANEMRAEKGVLDPNQTLVKTR